MPKEGAAFCGSCQDYVSIGFLKGLIRIDLWWMIYFFTKM